MIYGQIYIAARDGGDLECRAGCVAERYAI